MKVKVCYPVTRYIEIEIPENLAKPYRKAQEKDDDMLLDDAIEEITDYLQDTIPQIDAEVDYKPDIYDWDEVE